MIEPDSHRLECIVFDFDGTLAELKLDFEEMKRRLGQLGGRYLAFDPCPHTLPALEWLHSLLAALRDVSPPSAVEFQHKAQALIVEMELAAAHEGSLFSFTRDILKDLAARRIKPVIITRNCEQAVRITFPDLDRYCMGLLARDHVPRVKPDPDHLFRALHHVGASLRNALVVGDHPLDIQTGKRAGILTAGVWSGRASREDLIQSGAHWTARNCLELMQTLESQQRI